MSIKASARLAAAKSRIISSTPAGRQLPRELRRSGAAQVRATPARLFPRIVSQSRCGAWLTEVRHTELVGVEGADVGVVEKTVKGGTMPGRVVAGITEWQPGWSGWRWDTGIRAAWAPAVIPNDEALGSSRDKGIGFSHRTALAIVHPVGALPLLFNVPMPLPRPVRLPSSVAS